MRSTELFQANRIAAERRKAAITIRLVCDMDRERKSLDLPYQPRRDQLNRQEILGIMGMYHGQDRFPPDMVRPMLESGLLEKVIEGKLEDSSSYELLEIKVPCEVFARIEIGVRSRLVLA